MKNDYQIVMSFRAKRRISFLLALYIILCKCRIRGGPFLNLVFFIYTKLWDSAVTLHYWEQLFRNRFR